MRKSCKRKVRPVQLPPGLRPTTALTSQTLRDLAISHHLSYQAIASGNGDSDAMYSWLGALVSWHSVSPLGVSKAAVPQWVWDDAKAILARFEKHGVARFAGGELQRSREVLDALDEVAEQTPHHVALRATEMAQQWLLDQYSQSREKHARSNPK